MQYVLKIGSDYLTNVTIGSIEIGGKKNRAIFQDENHAKTFISLCKYFTNEEIKMITLEEDDATNLFNGLSLEEIVDSKTKKEIVERGRNLFEKGNVVSVKKLYSVGVIKYECECKSDTNYDVYKIVFELDKNKKYLKHTCTCPYGKVHTQTFCKHDVACALAILDY